MQDNDKYHFVHGDIASASLVDGVMGTGIDAIINFAAESHVDRSILDACPFIDTNIKGTQTLLDGGRKHIAKEIYTDIHRRSIRLPGRRLFCRNRSAVDPSSPYSASKASADLLCLAYWKTYGMPVAITRCTNNYGPYQFPEKLIPLVITNAIENKPVPVYGDGLNRRDWIFVKDHCKAINTVLHKGKPGEIYNIGGNNEMTNLAIIRQLLRILGKGENLIQFVADRLGHDRRYAVDTAKIAGELGWKPAALLDSAMEETVNWYLNNETWWRRIKSGEYATYYDRMYLQK